VSDVERFLARAEQAERLARDMISPDQRAQLLEIARDWREMARRAEAAEARSFEPSKLHAQ
jgi:hypothetical protein